MEYEPFYRVIPKINTNLLLASGVGNTAHYSAMLLTYMQAINAAKLQHGVLSRTVYRSRCTCTQMKTYIKPYNKHVHNLGADNEALAIVCVLFSVAGLLAAFVLCLFWCYNQLSKS